MSDSSAVRTLSRQRIAAAPLPRTALRVRPAPCPADPSGRLLYLDGWRGLSILLVLLGHFTPHPMYRLGSLGVECFFVLSGRLMADLLVLRRQPLAPFVARRLSRIVPGLAVYVGLMAIGYAISIAAGGPSGVLPGLAGGIGFFENYLPIRYVLPPFEHLWSLAVEEHSYALLALVCLLASRRRRTVVIAALALSLLAMLNGWRIDTQLGDSGQYAYWRTDARAGSVLLSFVFYLIAAPLVRARPWRGWSLVSPVSLAVGAALFLLPSIGDPLRFSLGTFLLALAASTVDAAAARFRLLLEQPALVWLGLVSYSLYLWQQPFFTLGKAGLPLLLGLGLAFGCAVLSYRRIERPARRYINARWVDGRWPEARAAETSRSGMARA